jgi:Variant SH3 domain
MCRSINFSKGELAVHSLSHFSHNRALEKTSKPRIRSTAHAFVEDEPPPPQQDFPRPVISTRYKSTSVSRGSPAPSQLRRTQTDTAAFLPPRPSFNGTRSRKVCRVDYAFDAESDSELSFTVGEFVSVIEEVDPGWFIGEIIGEETRQGLFPVTYCSQVDYPSPTSPRGIRSPLKPSSPTRSESSSVSNDIFDDPRRTSTTKNPRSQSLSAGPSVTAKKKPPPPPPPVSRGNKPSFQTGNTTNSSGNEICRECGCNEFRANVFKKGSCNNCFHVHLP